MENTDIYKTIAAPSEGLLFKEKGSKFIGFCFPVATEEDIRENLDALRKIHPNAVHHCYAYQIGTETTRYRANDDGEPSNSAGAPIFGQIQSFGLTNILVVVIRYFGGVKLGVGGLISAYKLTAQMAIESCEIIERTINYNYVIAFDYKNMNKVMRVIKEKNLEIVNQTMTESCEIEIAVRKNASVATESIFEQLFEITIKQKL